MKKSHIVFSIAALILAGYAVDSYTYKNKHIPCYEIVEVGQPLHANMLLDKCKGRTWTLVQTETSMGDLGYISEDGDDEDINTIVWTRVVNGEGVLTINKKDK